MIKLAAYGALAMAGALLGLQILGAIEYTEGGSLYARASVIAAMVALAALPVFIEAARHTKSWGLVVALGVAFVALLAYSLPATVGKTGEVKVAKVADAAAVARIRDDLERVTKTLEYARPDMMQECGSGEGKRCRAKRNTVTALEDRAGKLQSDLASGERSAPGDLGAETWAWASMGTLSAETVRKGGVVAFALGLDVAIWSLIWLATTILASPNTVSRPSNTVSALDYTEVPKISDRELEELRRVLRAAHAPLTNDELAAKMGVKKSEASKRVSKGVAAGLVAKHRVGREVAISLH